MLVTYTQGCNYDLQMECDAHSSHMLCECYMPGVGDGLRWGCQLVYVAHAVVSLANNGIAGGAPHSPMPPPAYSEPYPQQPSAGFQAGYAEGLRLAQQQLAQQHLQAMPPQHQPMPPQHQGYQQYWHPHQAPVPGYHSPAPVYNQSIMPASPAMNPSPAWQQHGQAQNIPNQAATFFRGRGRGHRGGGRS